MPSALKKYSQWTIQRKRAERKGYCDKDKEREGDVYGAGQLRYILFYFVHDA